MVREADYVFFVDVQRSFQFACEIKYKFYKFCISYFTYSKTIIKIKNTILSLMINLKNGENIVSFFPSKPNLYTHQVKTVYGDSGFWFLNNQYFSTDPLSE